MADFAQWAVAAEPALGMKPGKFQEAYAALTGTPHTRSRLEKSSSCRDRLLALLKRKGGIFEGTATQLLNTLAIGQDTRGQGLAQVAARLSGMLTDSLPTFAGAWA